MKQGGATTQAAPPETRLTCLLLSHRGRGGNRLQDTEAAVLATVDDVDVARVLVGEHEEVMAEQIGLEQGLVNGELGELDELLAQDLLGVLLGRRLGRLLDELSKVNLVDRRRSSATLATVDDARLVLAQLAGDAVGRKVDGGAEEPHGHLLHP